MKKTVATFLLISTFTLVPTMPTSAGEVVPMERAAVGEAATFKPCPRGTFRVRRKTSTKKKLLNAAITSGIGAALGAGIGGKRGAAIGAGGGAAGYLTYRYVRDRRGRCVRQYR